MKTRIIGLFLLFGVASTFAQTLLKNGDFSDGKRRWNGKWEIVEDGGNAFAELSAEKGKKRQMSQRIEVRSNTSCLAVRARYKVAPDYKGKGFQLRFERTDASYTFMDFEVKADGKWHPIKWDYTDLKNTSALTFIIETRLGNGALYFDDVVIETE